MSTVNGSKETGRQEFARNTIKIKQKYRIRCKGKGRDSKFKYICVWTSKEARATLLWTDAVLIHLTRERNSRANTLFTTCLNHSVQKQKNFVYFKSHFS